ncbi:hypothetical protein [Dactylosporangium sp. NPDC005555]
MGGACLDAFPAPFGVVQVVAVAAGRVTVLAGGVLTRIAQD